jgi:hypothetical protein
MVVPLGKKADEESQGLPGTYVSLPWLPPGATAPKINRAVCSALTVVFFLMEVLMRRPFRAVVTNLYHTVSIFICYHESGFIFVVSALHGLLKGVIGPFRTFGFVTFFGDVLGDFGDMAMSGQCVHATERFG